MKDTPMPPALTDLYYINDTNLDLRKKFIALTPDDVNVLRQLAGWAERHADAIAREFYDHQFAFAPTGAFFQGQARRKGLSLADLRQHLEKSQAGYFRQIFQEAVQGGRYGADYFAKRLKVGKLHNIINLPLKWYVGSYALYQDLVRRYLRRAYFFRPGFRAKAERAIFTVFNYDMQAVSDAFFYDYLQSIGLDLSHVAIASREHDLSENYAALKEAVRTALEETVRTSVHLAEASAQLAANAAQTGEATSQIAQTIQQVAMGITQQTASVSTTANSMEQMQRAIDGVARGAQEQARAIGQASNVVSRMSTAVDSIRHGAEAQADGAQRAEAMQALLAQSLRQVNDLAGQVSTQSQQSVTTAEEGARLAEANVSGIRRVFSTTEQLAQRVRDLGRRSGQIGAIVETITDIAAQTNLLALNAAIEAARAGEHGAGFAVVADEVRKLAERAAGATKEIAEMVQLIQSGATEVSETMGAVGVEVSNSVKHTEETGTAFQAIASGARGVSEQLQAARAAITAMDTGNHKLEQVVTEVKQIAERNRVSAQEMAVLNSQAVESLDGVSAVVEENTAATEQMAASATEVTQSVESIASVSEENSAAVEQVSASTEEMSAQVQEVSTSAQTLNEIAQKLQTVVAQFQLGEITAAPVSGPVAVPAAPRRMNGNGRSREKIPARPY